MELQPNPVIQRYLRQGKKLPAFFCPGCEVGIVMGALIRALNACNLQKDEIFLVSGVGCSGRIPMYIDTCSIQAPQGMALTIAAGVKLAKPHLKVVVLLGDGDALSFGGNALLHACIRNIGLTAIILNGASMSISGGQPSPTTPYGKVTSFAPYGNPNHPVNIGKLLESAGGTFFGRQTVYYAQELAQLIETAIKHNGFSVVEAAMICHVRPQKSDPVKALEHLRDIAVPVEKASKLNREKLAGKIVTGIIYRSARPELTEEYEKASKKIRG
ncbi:MAG TPA: thiamine pyrophosphate-dependent enzyme [Candidatus Omnitrophota bacterium]|nr:thiamine pyrophosphate-dependent enzyme [Candidatus Omnitrophota bacterium]